MAKEALHQRIDNDVTLHPPVHPVIGELMGRLREDYQSLAHRVVDRCPESRELSLALTSLIDDSMHHAIASIARYQEQVLAELGEDR